MPDALLVQNLGVSFQRDDNGREGLVYAPTEILPEDPRPERVFRQLTRGDLRQDLSNVFTEVDRVIRCALQGQPRGGADVRAPLEVLVGDVFPEDGFFRVVAPGIHPQFDISSDIAAEIPWEMLEERYLKCPESDCPRAYAKADAADRFCSVHGAALQRGGGILGLERHVSHRVAGGDSRISDGMTFLIIEDPLGDLCDPANDPKGQCADHLVRLKRMLAEKNLCVNVLWRKNATRENVVRALENPSLAGLYYFGHGSFPADGAENHLVLWRSTLSASQIADLNPQVRFVWLNACEGAATGPTWTLGRRVRSVAEALARGNPAKVVIAPIFPIVNTQAADAAIEFFESALGGETCGESLHKVRAQSYARYSEQMAPDLSWMAYRYFGHPGSRLRLAPTKKITATGPETQPGGVSAGLSRLFDQDRRLDTEGFGFAVGDVLFRAAKRRKRRQRTQATVGDFLLGLLRVGDLTRYLFDDYGLKCDEVYDQVVQREEAAARGEGRSAEGSSTTASEHATATRAERDLRPPESPDPRQGMERTVAELRSLITQFLIREEGDFHPLLRKVLEQADQAAQRGPDREDRRISEHDVLEAITADGAWPADLDVKLPPVGWIVARLRQREAKQTVDANGRLRLVSLTADAVRVVERAHALAQQRGISPIPNRLVLVAFLDANDGYPVELCRRYGADPARLTEFLLSLTRGSSPQTFLLSHASCRKIVLPMVERARDLRGLYKQTEVDGPLLFKAYCQVAQPAIKKLLLALDPPLRLDLDELAEEPLPTGRELPREHGSCREIDPDVRQVLQAAAQFAKAQGYTEIQPPHLFAALISEGSSVAQALLRRGTRPERLIREMLLLAPPRSWQGSPHADFTAGKGVEEALRRAGVYARAGRREAIAEKDLRKALLENPRSAVVQALENLGLSWLLTDDFDAPADAPP